MKRIDVIYGGRQYSIGNRDVSDIMAEIEGGVTSATPRWLTLNDGEGHLRPAHLLLGAGIDIEVIPVPDESVE
jgi:hypothetical protein